MGTVHLAWDPKLHREVAIKVLRPEVSRDAKIRTRFQREARAVAALRHPTIVEIYDYSGEESGQLYIVMEKLEGDDLFNIVADHGPMPEPIVAAVGHELCLALSVAHQAGIIHRDLKPENVFISPNGRIVLTDFGIVKAIDESAVVDGGGAATDVIGTPGFMPPELMMNKGLGPYTDVFALGVLLYNIATGQLPYDGPGPVEIFRTMMKGEFDDPRRHNKSLGEEMYQALQGTLEPKPKRRTQTVEEVREGLKRVLAENGVTDLRDDMREYMASPQGFWETSRQRTANTILQQIKIATKDRDVALAGRLKARLDVIDPENQAIRNVSGLVQVPAELVAETTEPTPRTRARSEGGSPSTAASRPSGALAPSAELAPSAGPGAPVSGLKAGLAIVGGVVLLLALVFAYVLWSGEAVNMPGPAAPMAVAPEIQKAQPAHAAGGAEAQQGREPAAPAVAGAPSAAQGSLEVVIKGGNGALFVDGERQGRARRNTSIALAPGEHVLEFRTGKQRLKKTVTIEAGKDTRVVVDTKRGRIAVR